MGILLQPWALITLGVVAFLFFGVVGWWERRR
jgi:IPTL-CTERM motif